ncbi:MAG: ABC transporter ATP-binding protein, partial [Lachnospiraceae bacterium]|nr:ABC transporter ATP-binding protein [Lachnospiraceae bacterium]
CVGLQRTLFSRPLHPYTRALLSAVPIPDPVRARRKQLQPYDPTCHDYSVDRPVWAEIEPGHYVHGNQREQEAWLRML